MGLRVIGAGLPRTGTNSLKTTLERLTGDPCYHMFELSQRKDTDRPKWIAALDGDLDRLDDVLAEWRCAVDWPTSVFWRELIDRHPDALVILSRRADSATWWASADATVWEVMRRAVGDDDRDRVRFNESMRRRAGLGGDWANESAAIAWYERHNAEVVATVPPERLLVWEPADGFTPIAERLGVPVPDVPTVHANTRAAFRQIAGFD